jgi:hypothetical protein
MTDFDDERLDQVWDKAKKVRGKDPKLYRRDSEGDIIYKPSYGKTSDMGWEVDHSKPVSKGGTDHLNNLNPLQWKNNREKSDN